MKTWDPVMKTQDPVTKTQDPVKDPVKDPVILSFSINNVSPIFLCLVQSIYSRSMATS